MPSFVQTGMKSNAMYDFENTNGGYISPVPNSRISTSESMARAETSNTYGGIASTNLSSTPRIAKSQPTFTASAPTSSTMTPTTMAPLGSMNGNLDKASTSYSYCRPTLSNGNLQTFQDLIKKGRKAQADDERTVYETKKAQQEADRAKATRARLATDTAVRSFALESRLDIDTCKAKLIDDMEKNLRALLESEIRAEIREKVYEEQQKISATYEREIKDSTKLQLENDLEPVIVSELSAKHEKEVKETLRAELQSEVKEELRAKYKAEVENDLRVELEDTVRKELQDMYRDEVRDELKRELSPSIRAELIASLGIQDAVPDLDDLDSEQSLRSDLGNMQRLNYNSDYQGCEGESQYDKEEGDDVFDDAPEQFGSGLVDKSGLPNPIIDADLFKGGLMNNDNLPSPIVDPNQSNSDLANNVDCPYPIIDADQSGSGSTLIGSQHLKRVIDEDFDESDEEEHSAVDCHAEKKVKMTPHCDLIADEGSPSASNIEGYHIDKQAFDDRAQYGENTEDGEYSQINGNVDACHGEEQLQKDEEGDEDVASLLLKGNSDDDYGKEPFENDGEKKDVGHFPPVNSNFNAYFGEEQPHDAQGLKEDEVYPDLNGNAYSNGNGNEPYAEERHQNNKVQYAETQYETFKNEEGGSAGYLNHDLKSNAFDHEEELDSREEGSEEKDEDEDEDDGEDEDEDEDEEEEEEEYVGGNGLPYGRAQEPLGNYFRARQIDRADSSITHGRKQYRNEDYDEDLSDTGLAYGRVQQPFNKHYGGTHINQGPGLYPHGMKHYRSEEEEEDEEEEAHDSKRHHGGSYPICEEEYSEVDSNEDDYESESQDGQGERNIYGLIKESNTQETAFVIDSSDEEDHSEAVDEEKTLVDDGAFHSSKIQTYVEESLFVES